MRSRSLFSLIVLLFALGPAVEAKAEAEPKYWWGTDRNKWEQTEYRKVRNDFGGILFFTPDKDWEQKWTQTSPETIVRFNETKSVRVGEKLAILLFVVNPKVDNANHVSVRCNIKVSRPDKSVVIDERGARCMSGNLKGNPDDIRLVLVADFVGKHSDLLGQWLVDVEVTDVNRDTTINLRRGFVLEPSQR